MLEEHFLNRMCVASENQVGSFEWDNDQFDQFGTSASLRTPIDVMSEYPYEYSDAWKSGSRDLAEEATFFILMTEISNAGDAGTELLKSYFQTGDVLRKVKDIEEFLEEQMELAKSGKALPPARIRENVQSGLKSLEKLLDERFHAAFEEFKRASRVSEGRVGNLNTAVTGKKSISLPRLGRQSILRTNVFSKFRWLEGKSVSRSILVLDVVPRIAKIIDSEHYLQQTFIETAKMGGQTAGVWAGTRFGAYVCRVTPAGAGWLALVKGGGCVLAGAGFAYWLGQVGEQAAEDLSKPIAESFL